MAKLINKRVVMVIAEKDFRDEELFEPKAVLEKAGVKVDVACTNKRQAKGTMGATITPDMLVSGINTADYDAVIFVGGNGSHQYWNDPTAHSIAKEAAASGKVVAAICIAPVILANAGLLDGKKATVWPAEAETLRDKGIDYTGKAVEVDCNVITANGPASAKAFGEALVKKLSE